LGPRLSNKRHPPHSDDGLALGNQLLGSLELADDLLRGVPGAFDGEVPGTVWPDEDSHAPSTDSQGPRHRKSQSKAKKKQLKRTKIVICGTIKIELT